MIKLTGILLLLCAIIGGAFSGLFALDVISGQDLIPEEWVMAGAILFLAAIPFLIVIRRFWVGQYLSHHSLKHLRQDCDGLALIGRLSLRCIALSKNNSELKHDQMKSELANGYHRNLAQAMINQIGEAAWVLDRAGYVLFMNQEAEVLSGYRVEELKLRTLQNNLLRKIDLLYDKGWQTELAAHRPNWIGSAHRDVVQHKHGVGKPCEWSIQALTEMGHDTYLLRIAVIHGAVPSRSELVYCKIDSTQHKSPLKPLN